MGDGYAIIPNMNALTVSFFGAGVSFLLLVVNGSGQTPGPQTANGAKPAVHSVKLGSVTSLSPDELFEMFDLNVTIFLIGFILFQMEASFLAS